MSSQEVVSVLTQLGLTVRQAEVYLAIVMLGQPTAKQIAQALQTHRAEVYRAIPELQMLGLIQKIVSPTATFRAVPLDEAISLLLQLNTQKQREIQAKAEQFVKGIKNYNQDKQTLEIARYCLTIGLKPVVRQYLKDLQTAQKHKDCIIKWEIIQLIINRDFEYLSEALDRGVKMRFITVIPEGEAMPQAIQSLAEKGSFEVKSAPAIPKANIDIFDAKITHFITASGSNLQEIEVLRSDNPALVDLLQDYFEMKWQAATTPCWSKKSHQS
ncbi:MAG: helix-turn-helix domain-containing protein [Candidatus Bathyarchaeia archaeon]